MEIQEKAANSDISFQVGFMTTLCQECLSKVCDVMPIEPVICRCEIVRFLMYSSDRPNKTVSVDLSQNCNDAWHNSVTMSLSLFYTRGSGEIA